ncbi:MAG: phosphoadenosine phosphosulfate reductase [Verrucomicrobiales bacterium]|jgi:phosphoadenosine phosphosulfate reductase
MATTAKKSGSNTKAEATKKAAVKRKRVAKSDATSAKSIDLNAAMSKLENVSAEERVAWTVENFGEGKVVLSSSFGAQSAVLLHMATVQSPRIPVVLIDTGYLFPETYGFVDELTKRLDLNLKIHRADLSPAWQEARFGKLWEQGVKGIEKYNDLNKVKPMAEAFKDLKARAWISGVRGQQSSTRKELKVLALKDGLLRVHPIIDWSDADVHRYLTEHDLPYHPLWEKGYISIGDHHTSHKITDLSEAEQARFFGLKRECGLHENTEAVSETGADFII